MKKIDLGQTITILANVGVIAGIVFLGYELHQNNEYLEQQEQYTYLRNIVEFNDLIGTNEDFARLIFDVAEDSPADGAQFDQMRRCYALGSVLHKWQWEYHNGLIASDGPAAQGWRRSWLEFGMADCWDRYRSGYAVDFVEFIDQNVGGRQP